MPIERVIHGSLPLGIDKDTPGYQAFTYTPGYKNLIDANSGLDRKLTTSYKPPATYAYYDWLGSTQNLIQDKNRASHLAKEEHPASLSYSMMQIDGTTKAVFVYAKDMGIDWTDSRPMAAYHSALICDLSDVKKCPILYCSSPIVCCDIMREAFFPNDGTKIARPTLLGYINALSGSNDIKLEHSAGFKEITEDGIIQFISTDNRLECLKKMLSALIQLKSGNEKCRIVIADEKNSILMWIAALSYIFPIENSLQLSFTTYGYSIGDFDINGVFVAELNNCKKTDDIAVTDYNFLQAQRSYAVFDFLELYFAPDAEVYNNLFMSMVENSFTINRQILEQYKNYVLAATSYRKMDSEYMDGAVLYMFMEKNKRLSSEQIKAAVIFARKYANKLEKRRIFEKVMSVYKEYVSDAIAQDVLIDYVRYCVNEGISSQKEVESILMNDVKITFLDLENVSFEMFSEQGRISEKICGFMDGYMEIAFVNAIGIDRLYGFMEQLQKHRDVQRISYIHTAICHYVNDGKGSFKYGGIEQRIASKIIGVFVIDDTAENGKRLDALIKKTNQIVTSAESQFLYTNAVYKTLQEKKLIKLSKKVVEDVAKAYLQHDPHTQKQLVSIIDRCGASSVYFDAV